MNRLMVSVVAAVAAGVMNAPTATAAKTIIRFIRCSPD